MATREGGDNVQALQLPFSDVSGVNLLVLKLDNQWPSHHRAGEMRNKLRIRMRAMAKDSNSRWGLGNKISTIAAHASSQNLPNYGVAVTGSAAAAGEFRQYGR